MSIDELREALSKIPATGAINKARREVLVKLLNALMAGEKK
jgi:hypothetical protein